MHNFNEFGGGPAASSFYLTCMIDIQKLRDTVEKAIEGTEIFVVDVNVSPDNEIQVEIDSPEGIDIDTCAAIIRQIEAVFDRDAEDYELEVGSAGLTAPFKVRGQYLKNIGNEVEALTADGRKITGVLKSVAADGSFTVGTLMKVKNPGDKRPHLEEVEETLRPADCKYVRYLIDFK